MATIKPQSYTSLAKYCLDEAAARIAERLKVAYHWCPDYKGYSNERLTRMMLESISKHPVDEDLDYEVVRYIMKDYAIEGGMSVVTAQKIVNAALGSDDGNYISRQQSRSAITVESEDYYVTVFNTLNKFIYLLNLIGVN